MKALSAVVCALLMLQFPATREAKSQDIPEDTLRMIEANKFSPETVRERFGDRLREMARKERQHPKPPLISWSDDSLRHKITHVEIPVRTEDDLARLRNLGIDCCPKVGWCECDMPLEQAARLKEEGIGYRTVSEQELQVRQEQWERISRWVNRRQRGPNDVIMASLRVNTEHDLFFLQSIGMSCCQDTGICECQITEEQWKHIAARGFRHGTHVIDTTQWGKETKGKVAQSGEMLKYRLALKRAEDLEAVKKVSQNYWTEGDYLIFKVTKEQAADLAKAGLKVEAVR